MGPKLHGERAQRRVGAVAAEDRDPMLARTIRAALESYLKGRKLVEVKMRQAEGRTVDGFLKITGEKGERLLLDFKATTTPEGALSSLEVGGRRLPLAAARRTP